MINLAVFCCCCCCSVCAGRRTWAVDCGLDCSKEVIFIIRYCSRRCLCSTLLFQNEAVYQYIKINWVCRLCIILRVLLHYHKLEYIWHVHWFIYISSAFTDAFRCIKEQKVRKKLRNNYGYCWFWWAVPLWGPHSVVWAADVIYSA